MELGFCPERWVDVFVTKSADDPATRSAAEGASAAGQEYSHDDEFCCSVQSVEFDPDVAGTAFITLKDSPWVLPTWMDAYSNAAATASAYKDIAVGDLVRIGGIATEGFTDYLTVVEIATVTHIANATDSVVVYDLAGNTLAVPTSTSTTPTQAVPATGIAHIALRLNANLNCTKLSTGVLDQSVDHSLHRQEVVTSNRATLATRNHAYVHLSNAAKAYPTETVASEKFFYPLYRAKNWTKGTTLVARLDHGVKQVAAVKLIGYQMVNKRQVGIQHAHEMQSDDFLILRIKELDGHVISNHSYANGAFAILRTGATSDNLVGAAEFSAYEPMGITCVPVHASNNTLRNMTIELTDRSGKPAHFGRLHLWFKLLVTHG